MAPTDWIMTLFSLLWLDIFGIILFVASYLVGFALTRFLFSGMEFSAGKYVAYAGPIGILGLTALAYASLFGQFSGIIAVFLCLTCAAYAVKFGGLSLLKNVAPPLFRLETIIFVLMVGGLLGLASHGPMLDLDGAASGDQIWYAAQAHAFAVNPIHLPDLSVEGARHTFARSAPIIWAAAFQKLPMTDPAPFFAATLSVFSLFWLIAGIRAVRFGSERNLSIDTNPLSLWFFISAIVIGAPLIGPVSAHSPPIALAIPMVAAVFVMVMGKPDPPSVPLFLSVVLVVLSFFTKVFIVGLIFPLCMFSIFISLDHKFGRPTAIKYGLSFVGIFIAYVVWMFWQFSEWVYLFKIPNIYPEGFLEILTPNPVSPNDAAIFLSRASAVLLLLFIASIFFKRDLRVRVVVISILCVVILSTLWASYFWIAYSAGLLFVGYLVAAIPPSRGRRHLFQLCAGTAFFAYYSQTWFPQTGDYMFVLPIAVVCGISGSYLYGSHRKSASGLGLFLIFAAVLLFFFGSLTSAATTLRSAAVVNLTQLLVPVFVIGAVTFSQHTEDDVPEGQSRNFFQSICRIAAFCVISFCILLPLMMHLTGRGYCNFQLSKQCHDTDPPIDIWRLVKKKTPPNSLIFTDRIGPTIREGYDYRPAAGERQTFISAWYNNGALRRSPQTVAEMIRLNGTILSGGLNPLKLSLSRDYDCFFAVTANSFVPPRIFKLAYRNRSHSIYEIRCRNGRQ